MKIQSRPKCPKSRDYDYLISWGLQTLELWQADRLRITGVTMATKKQVGSGALNDVIEECRTKLGLEVFITQGARDPTTIIIATKTRGKELGYNEEPQ